MIARRAALISHLRGQVGVGVGDALAVQGRRRPSGTPDSQQRQSPGVASRQEDEGRVGGRRFRRRGVVDDAVGGGEGRRPAGEEGVVGGDFESPLRSGRGFVAALGGDEHRAAAGRGGEQLGYGAGEESKVHGLSCLCLVACCGEPCFEDDRNKPLWEREGKKWMMGLAGPRQFLLGEMNE